MDGIPDTKKTHHNSRRFRLSAQPFHIRCEAQRKEVSASSFDSGAYRLRSELGSRRQETPTYPMDASFGWVNVISLGARNVITCESSRLPPLFGSRSLSNSYFGCVSVASQSYSLWKTWQQSLLVPTRRRWNSYVSRCERISALNLWVQSLCGMNTEGNLSNCASQEWTALSPNEDGNLPNPIA